MRNDRITGFLEDFLWAGSSAFLMSLSHLVSGMWWISLVALVPFLWRVAHATLSSSVKVGALFAVSLAFVASPLGHTPPIFVLAHVSVLIILCAAFAVAVNRIARVVGFNAVFMAVLWLPVEYLLDNAGLLGGISTLSHTDSAVLVRISSLLGTLMVSFVFVLVNALLLVVIARVVRARPRHLAAPACAATEGAIVANSHTHHALFYHLPLRRGPPLSFIAQ